MSNPRHAFEDDHGRYYNIPGIDKPLVSVTNAIGTGLAKHGLPRWYANSAAEVAWELLPMMLNSLRKPLCGIARWTDEERPCGECQPCVDRRIKQAAEEKRDSAAFLGTRVHELAEAHVLGKRLATLEGDDEAGLYVVQYLKFLKDFGIDLDRDIVAAESTVVHESAGYAGTGDLWVRLPFDGFLFETDRATGHKRVKVKKVDDPAQWGTFLIDLKTSRKRSSTQSYPDNAMQLAALRHAPKMLLPDDTLTPNIPVRGCATLQLRPKTYRLIPLPADTREYGLFTNTLNLASFVHHEWPGDFGHRPITPAGRIVPKRGQKEEDA